MLLGNTRGGVIKLQWGADFLNSVKNYHFEGVELRAPSANPLPGSDAQPLHQPQQVTGVEVERPGSGGHVTAVGH